MPFGSHDFADSSAIRHQAITLQLLNSQFANFHIIWHTGSHTHTHTRRNSGALRPQRSFICERQFEIMDFQLSMYAKLTSKLLDIPSDMPIKCELCEWVNLWKCSWNSSNILIKFGNLFHQIKIRLCYYSCWRVQHSQKAWWKTTFSFSLSWSSANSKFISKEREGMHLPS